MSASLHPIRRTYLEISLEAVRSNARAIAAATTRPLWAVVKADAYGHGATRVANALEDLPEVHGFAVSLVEEGVELRDSGVRKPVLVMGPALRRGYAAIADHGLIPLISREDDLGPMAEAAPGSLIHLKVDSGMTRLGVSTQDVVGLVGRAETLGLVVEAVATHLACADDDSPTDPDSMTAKQLQRFEAATHSIEGVQRHAANSAACAKFPAAAYDFVRPGLGLYGAGVAARYLPLKQAARLVTDIAQIRSVEVGQTVSYGALWRAERPSQIAVLPLGYADGVPRSLTGKLEVLIRGQRAKSVGAISMDMIVVDVTDLHGIEVGESVVLLGDQQSETISSSEFATRAGLTEYEVTCGISKRVPRVWQ